MEPIGCRLDPLLRRPGRRRLPKRPRTRRERKERMNTGLLASAGYALTGLFSVVDMILEMFFDLLGRLAGTPWREARRIFHGRCRSGGWDSEAGRFALTVFRHHWLRRRSRQGTLRLVPAPEGVLLQPSVDAEAHFFACTLREKAPPHRQRRRLDLEFPDGSWLALELPSPGAVAALRRRWAPG